MTDWAAPGSAPAQPGVAPGADAGPDGGRTGERTAVPLPPPPVPLRPLTIPDLLDGSFAILKRRPRDVVLLAACFVIPVEVLTAIALRDLVGDAGVTAFTDPGSALTDAGEGSGDGVAIAASLLGGTLSLVLLAGALTVVVEAWMRDVDVRPGEAVVATLRRSPVLVLAALLVKVLEAAGLFAFGIGAYVAMALCHVVTPAVMTGGTAGRRGPFAAVARSIALTRRRFTASLLVPAEVGLIALLVGFGFQLIPEVGAALTPDDWDWLVRASGQIASQLVIVPFVAGVAVLYHLDLRMRVEGYDVALRAERLDG